MAITKIVIDRDLCIGAGTCVAVAGDAFELDDENKAVIKLKGGATKPDSAQKSELAADSISDDVLLSGAQSCPTAAIFLYDENDQQIFP